MKRTRIAINWLGRLLPIFLAILVISAMTVPVWATKVDTGNTISATIKLSAATKVGNTQLTAGEYKVIADQNQAKFQKGGKVVAQVPCTLKPLSFMPKETMFVVENGGLSEIQVSGNEMAIAF